MIASAFHGLADNMTQNYITPAGVTMEKPPTSQHRRLWTQGVGRFADCEAGLLSALKEDGALWLETLLNDPELPWQLPPTPCR